MKKKPLILLVLPVLFLGTRGIQAADPIRRYPIPRLGTLELSPPPGWQEEGREKSPGRPERIRYTARGNRITISYHWNLTQISNITVDQIALARLEKIGRELLKRAKEETLTLRRWETPESVVFYFTLTDPRKGEKFRYLTHGSTTRGNLILMLTVLSADLDPSLIEEALTLLGNARFIPLSNRARYP